ncbi:MAG TPA: hypothetical protein VNC84_06740 [Gammaproteobacteria bacterium]|jgi:hypothetical protein|nr:hypothetical protein [Gammaproteobacteria bacterium]
MGEARGIPSFDVNKKKLGHFSGKYSSFTIFTPQRNAFRRKVDWSLRAVAEAKERWYTNDLLETEAVRRARMLFLEDYEAFLLSLRTETDSREMRQSELFFAYLGSSQSGFLGLMTQFDAVVGLLADGGGDAADRTTNLGAYHDRIIATLNSPNNETQMFKVPADIKTEFWKREETLLIVITVTLLVAALLFFCGFFLCLSLMPPVPPAVAAGTAPMVMTAAENTLLALGFTSYAFSIASAIGSFCSLVQLGESDREKERDLQNRRNGLQQQPAYLRSLTTVRASFGTLWERSRPQPPVPPPAYEQRDGNAGAAPPAYQAQAAGI